MPEGKPAGVRCVHLDERERCRIFGHPDRPVVCRSLKPHPSMCHDRRETAMRWLTWLERQTEPAGTESTASPSPRPPRI